MAMSTSARARRAPACLALVVLASASCADILGIEDPAGRLDASGGVTAASGLVSTGTGAGPATSSSGGGGGAGAGSTSSGGGAGSTSSAGGGGGLAARGALELPSGFAIHALGAAPAGAVALVKRQGQDDGILCGTTVSGERLAVVAVSESSCTLLAQLEGPGDSLQGLSLEQREGWLGFAGLAEAGTVTLHATSGDSTATLPVTGAGFFGMLNVTIGSGAYLLASAAEVFAGAMIPASGGEADVVMRSDLLGFSPDLAGACAAGAPGEPRVYFATTTVREECSIPHDPADGTLLDAKRGIETWALIGDHTTCSAAVGLPMAADRAVGGCSGPANLLVHEESAGDLTFAGMVHSDRCAGAAAIVEGTAAGPVTIWCDPDKAQLDRVVPFHVGDTLLHFLRSDPTSAALLKVPRGGGEAELGREVCAGCAVKDAVTAGGVLYVIGEATSSIEVFDEPITPGRSFWAWVPLADL